MYIEDKVNTLMPMNGSHAGFEVASEEEIFFLILIARTTLICAQMAASPSVRIPPKAKILSIFSIPTLFLERQ